MNCIAHTHAMSQWKWAYSLIQLFIFLWRMHFLLLSFRFESWYFMLKHIRRFVSSENPLAISQQLLTFHSFLERVCSFSSAIIKSFASRTVDGHCALPNALNKYCCRINVCRERFALRLILCDFNSISSSASHATFHLHTLALRIKSL